MKPYRFEPYLKPTLWGGGRLAPFKGISCDRTDLGESWEISGVPGHESVTAERGLADDADIGLPLPELIDRYGERLVGRRVYARFGNRFPLLVKFIDARQDLSIQVHPNDALAAARHGCSGKTEMWYVIAADAGARIHAGLKRPLTPAEFERLAQAGLPGNPFADVIASHESHAGDVYFLPAGRLHAIGAGNFLAEIQQTSDITYRVCDFGRRDAQGKLRQLHVAEAKDAIDYRVCPDCRTSYDPNRATSELVSCDYFRVGRTVVRSESRIDLGSDAFVIAVCLGGSAVVNGVGIRQGETLLVPAEDNILRITGEATFLTATA